ncbi:MAG: glycosyltransferase, partial [Nanoarchaeota archaeon]|nr:glycosyltransferase [Nanoarchaeota archaeon]
MPPVFHWWWSRTFDKLYNQKKMQKMGKRIMFYCHYSVGLGHFVRTFALAKGIKRVNPNSEILIVSGGAPVPIKLPDGIQGIKILNLPPLRESQNNRELEPLSDESADEVKKSRIIQIIKAYRLFKPDFLFVDHFPFGRIELKYEITALLDIAMNSNKKPKIISSIRDMAFVEKDHEEETGQMIEYFLNKYFDYLLVHSDYRVTCIEDEFEILKQVKIPIIYTGYVCSMSEEEIKENVKEKVNYTDADYPYAKNEKLILVSAGGGRSCFELIKKTIEAKEKLDKNKVKSRFLILAGPFLSEEEFLSLKELAKKHRGISLKRFIPDFIDVLKQADVSISNVGYNTTVELLLTKTKSLLIPHIKNSVINKEQLERAKKIKNIISAEILDPRELNPMKIADCLNKLMSSKQNQGDSKQFEVDLNGAEFAGEFISNLNKPCRVFFRDDDVHEVTDKFIDLNNLFSDKNIPIHYSVIPCTMSKNLIEYLNNIKKKQHNIEIGQHGWSHKKHGDSVSYEFGDKRSYSEQYEDISKGRNKIESNFEINPNLVFTPPHNRLNSDTIKVLEKLDFRIISSSCYSDEYNKIRPPQKIRDIPICLDLFIKIDDKWILKDKRELIKEFFIKKQNGIVGIMIHHKFFSDKKEFELLNEFIDLMIREKVQFKSFAQINNYLKQSKKTIAYLRSNYLPASENFIYQEIKNINQSDSCYAAVISVVRENENIFSGVEVIEQPRFKSLHTANYPFIKNSQLKLYSQFMNFCADEIMSRDVSLLHAQFGDDGLFFLPLKRKTGLPLVVSFRGFDLYRLPNQFPRVYNPLFKEADLFLVRSNSMKKDLINLGCHAEKVNVHHSSIDLDEIDAILNKIQNKEIRVNTETIKEEKRVNEKIKLIFAGRFVEKKGIFDIIKAFSGLKQEGKDIELKLIGDGPLKKQAEKMVYDLEIKDITFMTFLSHEDLIKEIKKSDIFVLPGKTAKDCNKEGIPVILMEAMACGLPVVSTFHSGIPELV